MIPGVIVGITRNTRGNPRIIDIVPDIPFMSARHAALGAPNEAHPIEVLVNVEFEDLRNRQARGEKVCVVREIMNRWNQNVIDVWQPLGRVLADYRIRPENI